MVKAHNNSHQRLNAYNSSQTHTVNGGIMEWISVKDRLPEYGAGSFLAFWKTQGNIMLVCFVDIYGNYVIAGSSRDTCGVSNHPKFTHWMPLPEPPKP